MSRRMIALSGALVLAVAFVAYLWVLYGQLEYAFSHEEEFVPTRIYSDVTRIFPPLSRSQVEARLSSLGYSPRKTSQDGTENLIFQLHPITYPAYLVPDGHPVLDAASQPITLRFDGSGATAALQSIQIGDQETPELYLEPEIIATLSRGNQSIRAVARFADIPAPVWQAIIAVEDQHFLDHKGLDPRGFARAIWVNLKTFSLAQGGSTLTQQLVKNLMARRTKNLFRKFNELFLALILEIKFDKERILERYLNEVYLGQVGSLEIHGVTEGARHFFGKRLEELNLAEIALMAGLIRGPGFYSPYRYKERAMERQRFVLQRMVDTGQIAEGEMEEVLRQPIRLAPPVSSANKAPYFVDFVKAELIRELKDRVSEQEVVSAGFKVYTTLDPLMNAAAQKAVAGGIAELEARLKVSAPDRIEGALAAVDHTTGYIRALIGGRSYSQSTFNRILNMKRQVGSTFKPVVYLAALAKGTDPEGRVYGPGRPVEDGPWKLLYDRGKQTWAPRNYDKEFRGWISLRTALANSVNTVASRLGMEVGIDEVIKTARSLGISAELPAVPSLSLGVAELSPVELLRAYATIANHGVQDELTVIRGITQNDNTAYARFVYHPKQVFEPGPVDLLTDMLQSVFIEGTARGARAMGFDRPAAGKTGTTSHHRDAWFAGFTPQLTAVVWTGLDQTPTPQPSPGLVTGEDEDKARIMLTGAGSALPIWIRFMKESLSGEPPAAFPLSPHLTNVRVDRHTGMAAAEGCPDEQAVVEKYVIGHEPEGASCEAGWPASRPETSI